jgi:hypothetical protein
MDFLRPRAVQALALAALLSPAAHAGCSLDGAYRYASETLVEGQQRTLGALVPDRERKPLSRVDKPSGPNASWDSDAARSRPRITNLASTVVVTGGDAHQLAFRDDKGASLVTAKLDPGWKCAPGALTRSQERLTGLGDDLREERVEVVLKRDGNGDLVLTETTTVLDPPGRAPRRVQARFKAVR